MRKRTETTPDTATGKRLYSRQEAAQQLSVGLSTVQALVNSGELKSVTIGRSRRILGAAIDEYVQKLYAQQSRQTA